VGDILSKNEGGFPTDAEREVASTMIAIATALTSNNEGNTVEAGGVHTQANYCISKRYFAYYMPFIQISKLPCGAR